MKFVLLAIGAVASKVAPLPAFDEPTAWERCNVINYFILTNKIDLEKNKCFSQKSDDCSDLIHQSNLLGIQFEKNTCGGQHKQPVEPVAVQSCKMTIDAEMTNNSDLKTYKCDGEKSDICSDLLHKSDVLRAQTSQCAKAAAREYKKPSAKKAEAISCADQTVAKDKAGEAVKKYCKNPVSMACIGQRTVFKTINENWNTNCNDMNEPVDSGSMDCSAMTKNIDMERMVMKKACSDPKSKACQEQEESFSGAEEKMKDSGCDSNEPMDSGSMDCGAMMKNSDDVRTEMKAACDLDPKSMACEEQNKSFFAAVRKINNAGCIGGDENHHHRIHWGSIAWAVTSCVSVGAIGVVVTKKIQAFNSDQDVYEAFIDNEQA